MDVESRLRSAGLPHASVDTEAALTSTKRHGRRRRQRRMGVLGAVSVALSLGLIAVVFGLGDDESTRVATGSAAQPSASPPPSDPQPGDAAVWDIASSAPPSSDSSTFTALVTGLGCNDGLTEAVLRPGVVITETEVVVTFTVEAISPEGDHTCPGNNAVPYVVDVGQPVGERNLVDGACIDGGQAATTSFCDASSGVRWRSDGAEIYSGDFAVSGRMVSVGGRAGAGPDPAPGTVRALDGAGATVASTETDGDGRFELALPNGTYRVVGRSPLYQNGEVDCIAERDVVVRDHYVDGVTVECVRR